MFCYRFRVVGCAPRLGIGIHGFVVSPQPLNDEVRGIE